jgi:hypothetical protein
MRKVVLGLVVFIVALTVPVIARQTTIQQHVPETANGMKTWLVIPCVQPLALAGATLVRQQNCDWTEAPTKVVFKDFPDASSLCIAAANGAPEVCVLYSTFKQFAKTAR